MIRKHVLLGCALLLVLTWNASPAGPPFKDASGGHWSKESMTGLTEGLAVSFTDAVPGYGVEPSNGRIVQAATATSYRWFGGRTIEVLDFINCPISVPRAGSYRLRARVRLNGFAQNLSRSELLSYTKGGFGIVGSLRLLDQQGKLIVGSQDDQRTLYKTEITPLEFIGDSASLAFDILAEVYAGPVVKTLQEVKDTIENVADIFAAFTPEKLWTDEILEFVARVASATVRER